MRGVGLLRRAAEGLGARFGGVLGFHPREAKHLVAQGFRDILVAYPSAHPADLDALCDANASGATVTAMIDDAEQLTRLDARARARGVVVPVALDVDMAWRAGPAVLGVRRSPLRAPEAVLTLARAVRDAKGVSLRGIMGYEAQIAGLTDRDAHGRGITSHRVLKALSRPDVLRRRAAVCAALRAEGFTLDVVNGGGTGSLRFTSADPAVNEVVLRSVLLLPPLFDALHAFSAHPAACFALQASRRPAPDLVTSLGGGWVPPGHRRPRPPPPASAPHTAPLPPASPRAAPAPAPAPPPARVTCDLCDLPIVVGLRWKCVVCADFDACASCFERVAAAEAGAAPLHDPAHPFLRLSRPLHGDVDVRVNPPPAPRH